MFTQIGSWFAAIWNTIISSIQTAGTAIVMLLPDSPFEMLSNSGVSQYMGWLNWLVPIQQMVAILELWTTAILIYYIYVVILRWIKAIQ